MIALRRPFVLRVDASDPDRARAIAAALVGPLRERGARVMVDGAPQGGGSTFGVHVITSARERVGAALWVGVNDEERGPQWLAPMELPADTTRAAATVIPFLEAWGFISGARVRADE